MTDALLATLHSYKSLATRKQLQVTLEIPEEYAETALKMLGTPDPSGTQWFALTRAQIGPQLGEVTCEPSGNSVHEECAHPSGIGKNEDKPRTSFKDMKRSAQAALKCQDKTFGKWLSVPRWAGEGEVNAQIKANLGIESKTELDTDPEKAAAWDALLCDFDMRELAR